MKATEESQEQQDQAQNDTFIDGFYNMGNSEYHNGPGLSSSILKKIVLQSPAHAMIKTEQTPAMAFGSAFHARILEPEIFEKQYTTLPEGVTLRHKEGKQIQANAAAKGIQVLPQEDASAINSMRESLMANRTTRNLLTKSPGINEQAAFWTEPATGVLCKCKPDRRLFDKPYLIDLKTCTSATPKEFGRDVFRFGYYISAAFYLRGLSYLTGDRWRTFVLIAVEKTPPYGVRVFPMSDMWIMMGEEMVQQGLMTYAQCLNTGHWPCYPTAPVDIHPEAWMINQILPPA
jgi:exodeoxyribonuclease VIII